LDLATGLAGLLVGFLVGLTGVGGGSLMAPLLILLFGTVPIVAVGTDLWFAAATKTVGAIVHGKVGSPDWQIFRRLAIGSIPAALLTLAWLALSKGGKLEAELLLKLLGAALMVTAILTLLKGRLRAPLARIRGHLGPTLHLRQLVLTVASGAVVGCLVTLTSVGAGALVAVILMALYPFRLTMKAVVGTDIAHAVPLALVAAIGHSWFGNVDLNLLVNLLAGSIPGVIVGSMASGRVNEALVRTALAMLLAFTGAKLLFG